MQVMTERLRVDHLGQKGELAVPEIEQNDAIDEKRKAQYRDFAIRRRSVCFSLALDAFALAAPAASFRGVSSCSAR